jgi:putative toxin-antitoxin system antitoxin component (TIGR02293 family)
MAEIEIGLRIGSAAFLGLPEEDAVQTVKRVERGLPYATVDAFLERTKFSAQELSQLIGVPARTLHRRRVQGRLSADESDRLLRVSRVFCKAAELFEGDMDSAIRWLRTPAKALRGEQPIAFARTEAGSREVEILIGRLEHGVLV